MFPSSADKSNWARKFGIFAGENRGQLVSENSYLVLRVEKSKLEMEENIKGMV